MDTSGIGQRPERAVHVRAQTSSGPPLARNTRAAPRARNVPRGMNGDNLSRHPILRMTGGLLATPVLAACAAARGLVAERRPSSPGLSGAVSRVRGPPRAPAGHRSGRSGLAARAGRRPRFHPRGLTAGVDPPSGARPFRAAVPGVVPSVSFRRPADPSCLLTVPSATARRPDPSR